MLKPPWIFHSVSMTMSNPTDKASVAALIEELREHAIAQTKSLAHLTDDNVPWKTTLWWRAADALSPAQGDGMRDALVKIADFDDSIGNARLEKHGEYSGFDEPRSVKIAREALASHPDRQPGMTDEEAEIHLRETILTWKSRNPNALFDWSAVAIAAIKRASQRQ